jgi:hypothetical protein
LADAAFEGDFIIVLKSIAAPKMVQNAVSSTGLISLALFMVPSMPTGPVTVGTIWSGPLTP